MKRLMPLCALLLSMTAPAATLNTGDVVLLQPDAALQQKGLDIDGFAHYVKAAQALAVAAALPVALPPASGFVVMAVRAGNRSNAWVDIQPALPTAVEQQLLQNLRKLPPFHVTNGTVLFAIQVMVNGAAPPAKPYPQPQAWQAVAATRTEPVEVEELVQLVWP